MAEDGHPVAPPAGVGTPTGERWEYGYLYFVQTLAPVDGSGQPSAGPTVTVVADGAGHRCAVLAGRRLEVLNELGGQGWLVSDGLWNPEQVRWLAEVVGAMDGVDRMVGYWQSFMRRRLLPVAADGGGESAGGV
ncbi:hypothetical protein [Micromonospora sp. NBC_01813]|uniref:hypothetical protein n=1 Tax=Micromonospora sp. NBC_01813 TaxID=2975988 RepID=UPI002DDC3FA8|nr:hypothetical protein [Micromonospora sp. NBC_01813]WSA10448.1 hypothetical protein OG958_06565 [Micromonospora sp. NBC_01813]